MMDTGTVPAPAVITAGPPHLTAIGDLLTTAFLDGDLASFLVPDEQDRPAVYDRYFRMVVDNALHHGHVEMIGAAHAVALWFEVDDSLEQTIPDYGDQLLAATGRYVDAFRKLDTAMDQHHPPGPHHYLAFLAVQPLLQGQGLGSRMLAVHHQTLDSADEPAYLEATSLRNAQLYQLHGYRLMAPIDVVPNGPQLYPMWRAPRG